MGSDSIPLWVIFFICVVGGAYFAATESSFSAVNKIKIKTLADDGNKKAQGVMYKFLAKRTMWKLRSAPEEVIVTCPLDLICGLSVERTSGCISSNTSRKIRVKRGMKNLVGSSQRQQRCCKLNNNSNL